MSAAARLPIISPRDAFFPPTCSRSLRRRSLSQAMRIAIVFYRYEPKADGLLPLGWHRHHRADARPQLAYAVRRRRVQPGHAAVRRYDRKGGGMRGAHYRRGLERQRTADRLLDAGEPGDPHGVP